MISDIYDAQIKLATSEFMPNLDYRWFIAQFYQESLLNPTAQSGAGAQGLCQFMPDTWTDVCANLSYPDGASPFDASLAIRGGLWYMKQMWRGWTSPRPDIDHLQLAQASYNAGLGHIYKAQKLANMAKDYATIIAYLPQITGKVNANQTKTYVVKIQNYYGQLVASGR